jgi:hypothetical protein
VVEYARKECGKATEAFKKTRYVTRFEPWDWPPPRRRKRPRLDEVLPPSLRESEQPKSMRVEIDIGYRRRRYDWRLPHGHCISDCRASRLAMANRMAVHASDASDGIKSCYRGVAST